MSEALLVLAADLAAAECADEASMLLRATRLLIPSGDRDLQRWLEQRAFAQAAIALHRLALPDHGFQLAELPPGAARNRGSASTWRHGEHRALPFIAATPALALLRAGVHAASRAAERRAQGACETCRGLGWFVTADNRKQICRHGA